MTVSVKGAKLFYTVRGTGPTCLVLSSIGTKPYERLMPEALDGFLQLVFVDLRGGGRSTGNPADLTFDVLADDLEAIRRALGVDRVAVLGHSILGALAIEYSRRRPGSVSHVIAVGTPPHGDMLAVSASATAFFEQDASQERKHLLKDNLALLPPNASLRQTTQAQTPMRFFEADLDTSPLFAEADVKIPLMQHLMGTLTPEWDITVDAAGLKVPIFLAHGRYDYTVPHTMWAGVLPTLPGVTLRRFERSGHHPFFEEPDQFANVLATWMADSAGFVTPAPKFVPPAPKRVAEESEDSERAAIREALERMAMHEQLPTAETPEEAGWDDDVELPRADALIVQLGLEPHPEGGHYRQIYRSSERVQPADDRPSRASLTTIYFLLTAGTFSRWHRVRSDEAWHFCEGEPIELLVVDAEFWRVERVTLGPLSDSSQPVHVVPAGSWQAARPVGAYGLASCTVAPGFEFEDFDLLGDNAAAERALLTLDPMLADLV